jgi:hypothetical protein
MIPPNLTYHLRSKACPHSGVLSEGEIIIHAFAQAETLECFWMPLFHPCLPILLPWYIWRLFPCPYLICHRHSSHHLSPVSLEQPSNYSFLTESLILPLLLILKCKSDNNNSHKIILWLSYHLQDEDFIFISVVMILRLLTSFFCHSLLHTICSSHSVLFVFLDCDTE